MKWSTDQQTELAATKYPIYVARTTPADQFAGFRFNPTRWNHRVIQPSDWPNGALKTCPGRIIEQFELEHYTQGLAMVVSWGKMWRGPSAIWGSRSLESIEAALRECALSIQQTEAIDKAWMLLTGAGEGQLGWSAVISSKTLHFLSRALDFEEDPPVALDNAVMRQQVWPAFVGSIQNHERPGDWTGNSLAAYYRYMTAIRIWARRRGWTTTEMEATLFSEY